MTVERMTAAQFLRQQAEDREKKPKARRPPRHLEAREQGMVVGWARNQYLAYPERWPGLHLLHCSLNGVPLTKAQASRAREQGMLAGIPDLFLPVPRNEYHGLYIEMKKQEGGRLSADQREKLDDLRALGYKCAVCHGHEQAVEVITEYYRG